MATTLMSTLGESPQRSGGNEELIPILGDGTAKAGMMVGMLSTGKAVAIDGDSATAGISFVVQDATKVVPEVCSLGGSRCPLEGLLKIRFSAGVLVDLVVRLRSLRVHVTVFCAKFNSLREMLYGFLVLLGGEAFVALPHALLEFAHESPFVSVQSYS